MGLFLRKKNPDQPKPELETKKPEPKRIKEEKKEEAVAMPEKKKEGQADKKLERKQEKSDTKVKKEKKTANQKKKGGDGQQRAAEVGDVITGSEIMYIKQMVKRLWNIPATAISLDQDVQVLISIDRQGSVTNAKIVRPKQIEDLDQYLMLEDSIQSVLENQEFRFSELTPKTLGVLAKGKPLDLIFNPKDVV